MTEREGYQDALLFTISLCLVFSICVGLLRLWIRRNAYGRDDILIGAATLLSFGHFGASYAALIAGLGKKWARLESSEDLAQLNQASIADIILFFVALYFSKCAMIAFLTRITKFPAQIRLYHFCNGVVAIIGIVSIVAVTPGCPASPESGYYWAFGQNAATCHSQSERWQVVTGLDCATEVLLLLLPVHLVWGLQMRFAKKAMIIVAFWIRLPVLGFSIGRNYFTSQLDDEQSDAGLDPALVIIWLEIELAYAIAASTLSALKTFTESFNTGWGIGQLRGKGDDSYGLSNVSGSSGRSTRNEKTQGRPVTSSAMAQQDDSISRAPRTRNARSARNARNARNSGGETGLKLRPEDLKSVANISSEPVEFWQGGSSIGSESSSSGEDMAHVIVRETAYEVQHDRAPMLPAATRYA